MDPGSILLQKKSTLLSKDSLLKKKLTKAIDVSEGSLSVLNKAQRNISHDCRKHEEISIHKEFFHTP